MRQINETASRKPRLDIDLAPRGAATDPRAMLLAADDYSAVSVGAIDRVVPTARLSVAGLVGLMGPEGAFLADRW